MNKNKLRFIASAGLLWNFYGVYQFAQSIRSTKESLLKMGMNESQAQLMLSYPTWMSLAFGIGTIAGAIGCVLLLAKSSFARPVFLTSLVGYSVLFVGDITEGVFAALGAPQVAILTIVMIVAAGLWCLSKKIEKELIALN